MVNFWRKIRKPIIALAPMADVTDAAFRNIISGFGKPDVMYTEFTSAEGLFSPGRRKLMINLKYSEQERPIVAQLFSSNPEKMRSAAALVQKLGFDGVDINMGCPDRAVVRQGSGGALIRNPSLAKEIIRAAKEGAPDLPVSVKTRVGFSRNELKSWLPEILSMEPAAVIVHARTVKEMSKVPARWEEVKEAVDIRNSMGSQTYILGNGDIADVKEGRKKAKEFGADGAMIGRAIFGAPWLFSEEKSVSVIEKLNALYNHLKTFDRMFGKKKNFSIMKKHFKAYISGFDGAKEMRAELMESNDIREAKRIIKELIKSTI